ncbi:MAG: hypothetical protein LBV42_03160 [Methanobrevibacter sp.]|jgi:hypothetical protein|nr:hypothetical protein [Methanobrevibacter sp.]
MFKKIIGLLIVYFIITLSIVPAFNAADSNNGTGSDNGNKGNGTSGNNSTVNSTVNISTEHYYSLNNNLGNGWDVRYPYYNFSSSYYKDGVSINKDGTVDYGGLLAPHDKANNRLVSEKDSFKSNVDSIVDIANKTFEMYPDTYYDSGSNSSFRHVPRAQLALMQDNYRRLNSSAHDMEDFYNLGGGEVGMMFGGFVPIIGAITSFAFTSEWVDERQRWKSALGAEYTFNGPLYAMYKASKIIAEIASFTTKVVIGCLLGVFSAIAGLSTTFIGVDFDVQHSKALDLVGEVDNNYNDLMNESVTAPNVNKLNYADALHSDLNRTTNETEKELVLQDYKLKGYTITYLYNDTSVDVNITNNSTAGDLNNSINKTVAMSNDIILNDTNSSNFFIRPSKVNNSFNVSSYKPFTPRVVNPDFGIPKLPDLVIIPDWDPWVTPDMAPTMGHYKWYQFYKYVWDAIKIACFWIGFVIALILYTIYWLLDFLIIEPIISFVKLGIYLVKIVGFYTSFDSEYSTANQDMPGYSDGEKVVNPSLSFCEVNSLDSEPDSSLDINAKELEEYNKLILLIKKYIEEHGSLPYSYNNTTNSSGV